jgi:hypothetical protein
MENESESELALTPREQEESNRDITNIHAGILAIMEDEKAPTYVRIQKFRDLLNKQPKQSLLKKHPYINGARYLPISHIEGMMDAFFFRQWGIRDFNYKVISNEIVGDLQVWYIDPITHCEITRIGAAAIQIMVDAIPKEIKDKMSSQERNLHATNVANKKANALEAGFAKLKAQCFKNACSSIGSLFGRDVNREVQHTPFHLVPQNFDHVKKLTVDESRNSED